MLQFVDPTVLSSNKDSSLQEDGASVTALHHLADLLDPNDYSTHESQIILQNSLLDAAPTSTLHQSQRTTRPCRRHAPGTT
jgi:hypothetical protein